MSEKHSRSAHHQLKRPAKAGLDSADDARAYLVGKRGADVALEIADVAKIVVGLFVSPNRNRSLTARERKTALSLARKLEPLVQKAVPSLCHVLRILIDAWSKASATARRGRQRGDNGRFMHLMLQWAAGDLAARDQAQLTTTEAIAAACVGGLPGVTWAGRAALRDSWRKLHKENLPNESEASTLGAAAREKLRAEAERKAAATAKWEAEQPERDRLALSAAFTQVLEDLRLQARAKREASHEAADTDGGLNWLLSAELPPAD